MANDLTPAGVNAVVYLTTTYTSTGTNIHDYCHDFSNPPHTTAVTPSGYVSFPTHVQTHVYLEVEYLPGCN